MKTQERKWWLAILLGLPFPGLGQIYNGQLKKGIMFYVLYSGGIFLSILIILGGLAIAPLNLGIAMLCFLVIYFYIAWDAFKTARRSTRDFQRKRCNHWLVYLIAIVVILFVSEIVMRPFLRTCVLRTFSIPSMAMADTFLSGDYIFASMSAYGIRIPFVGNRAIGADRPDIGDLVIFKFPKDPKRAFIKRCIAIEGQIVKIENKGVYVDGKRFEDAEGVKNEDLRVWDKQNSPRDNFGPYTVPDGHFFVLGDNRDDSYDSRFWGAVPVENLLGKAIQIYFSEDEESGKIRWLRIGQIPN